MKKLFSSIVAILIIVISQAQWSYLDLNSQAIRKNLGPITSDPSGNTIITGQFETSITLGGITVNNPTPYPGSYNTVFVGKMLANENFAWVTAILPQQIPNDQSYVWAHGAN